MTSSAKLSISQLKEKREKKLMDTVGRATAFYRSNPHRFVEDYFDGITLRLFQKILLFMMNYSNFFILFSSRGLGKTYLIAIFCCVRCILYPNSKIVIASSTRTQGNLVLSKIQDELMKKSMNLRYEIADNGKQKDIKINSNAGECYFKNGSWIKVVTMSDTARGNRANILFVDEFVQTDKDVIDTVLKKFLSSDREPAFLNKPEYKDYPREQNKELYASSAWYKSHWSYKKLKTYVKQMVAPTYRRYFACCIPYQIAILEHLLSRERVEDEMSEDDFNELTWMMEMECMFYGDTEESFFRLDNIAKRRVLENAFPKLEDVMGGKEKVPQLGRGERRVLSVDVALMASVKHKNDASSILINCAIPNKNGGFVSNYVLGVSYEGLITDELGMYIMRYFYLYNCTDLVLDTNGIGTPVFDYICQDRYDPKTGMSYGALTTVSQKDYMASRCKVRNAKRCVWSIKANAEFNNRIATYLRNSIDVGKINLLIDQLDAKNKFLENNPKFRKMSSKEQIDMLMPYVQTSLLVDELINLKAEINGTKIRLRERSGKRKDRYSSMAYNNYVIERIARKQRNNEDDDDLEFKMVFKKPVIRKF